MTNKVLFAHDGPLMVISETGKYLGIHYNDEVIKRYASFGAHVTFLMRMENIQNDKILNFSEISYPHFDLIEVPNFKSLMNYHKRIEAKAIIEDAVMNHDVIIVRLPSAIGTIAYETAVKNGKPVLVEFVACVFDALWNYNWKGKILAHYKYHKYRRLMKKASHTIYVTENFLQSRYPTYGKSIGCSDVVLGTLTEDILTSRLKRYESISRKKSLVLGTVAAIDVPYKGQADVIKAIGILKNNNKNIQYKIVGQGNPLYLQSIIKESSVEDRVEILGSLRHSEIFKFLDDVDIYIQPSKQEGLPRAVVEAMSRATFSMGAKTAGIPELIDADYIFEPGDITGICKLLLKVDRSDFLSQASINFNKSKKFQKSVLDEKRNSFYTEFMKDYNLF